MGCKMSPARAILSSTELLCMHSGLILRLPIWNQPRGNQIFDDEDYWMMPELSLESGTHGSHAPNGSERNDIVSGIEMKKSEFKDVMGLADDGRGR